MDTVGRVQVNGSEAHPILADPVNVDGVLAHQFSGPEGHSPHDESQDGGPETDHRKPIPGGAYTELPVQFSQELFEVEGLEQLALGEVLSAIVLDGVLI